MVLHWLAEQAGLEPVKIAWMNMPGMLGWFLAARVLRRPLLPRGPLQAFNVLAPVFQNIEACWQPPIGQSLLFIGVKR